MRKKIVAGNWKMNLFKNEANELFTSISESIKNNLAVEVVAFPPALFVSDLLNLKSPVSIGVQNFYPKEKGAFTGEISITQIKDLGVKYALVGHSERRLYFNESNEFLKEKVDAGLENDITIVFCCGEPLDVRESGNELSFVKKQIEESLFHLSEKEIQKIIVAYEPVWAIGTGKTATIEQAESMHKSIRSWFEEKYSTEIANSISILYGGSCNASNAKELFQCPNVDGGLIGGAALDASSFLQIANSF